MFSTGPVQAHRCKVLEAQVMELQNSLDMEQSKTALLSQALEEAHMGPSEVSVLSLLGVDSQGCDDNCI